MHRILGAWGTGLLFAALGGLLILVAAGPVLPLLDPLGLVSGCADPGTAPGLLKPAARWVGGEPARTLAARLDRLRGQTGLDPLDPVQPLADYRVQRVTVTSFGGGAPPRCNLAVVRVELRYAGSGERTYEIPVAGRGRGAGTTMGWRATGVDALLAHHEALPSLPPAGLGAPIRLGVPRRLDLRAEAHALGTASLGGWLSSGPGVGAGPQWAPDGRAVLLEAAPPGPPAPAANASQLWVVPLNGAPPRRLALGVRGPIWSADGGAVVYVSTDQRQGPSRRMIVTADPKTGETRLVAATDGTVLAVGESVIYLVRSGLLWRVPYGGGTPEALGVLPDLSAGEPGAPDALAVSPDGRHVGYRCGSDLCLADVTGDAHSRLALGTTTPAPRVRSAADQTASSPASSGPPPVATTTAAGHASGSATSIEPAGPRLVTEAAPPTPPRAPPNALPRLRSLGVAWSPNGARLAVTVGVWPREGGGDSQPVLLIVSRAGEPLRRAVVGPDGPTGAPQWTPDGRFLFLNTFPAGGRRIIAVDAETGEVLDLTHPGWDAFATLAPDGAELLLWNGRGGFWTAPVERPGEALDGQVWPSP